MGTLLRRCLALSVAALAASILVSPAGACPFCSMQGQTLTDEVGQASMVLFGKLTNPKIGANGNFDEGSTDLVIEEIIKKDPILGDKKVLTLPRYVPSDQKNPKKFLIFCDVFKGKIDPYRGVPVEADSDIAKYLKGAMEQKNKEIKVRLRFFFDYLDNADLEISNDAYKEFAKADYKDYREMAGHLPPDKIARWLEDPKTPAFRFGLYASMLGHCGQDKHAKMLRTMLDDPTHRLNSGVDGMLAGYTMLKPKDGWAYTRGILSDPSKEFMLRYAALRTGRFFHDSRPDVVGTKDVVAGVSALLDQSDIADLAIEDLRRWACWDLSGKILGLYGKKSHDIPIVRRAILRFALSCPPQMEATTAFIADQRKKDPEMVKDAEELLKLESGK